MVRVLSFHAHYRCRHSGACCTSGWPIPVEPDRFASLQDAVDADVLEPKLFADAEADRPAVLRVVNRQCVFLDADRQNTCRVHETLGHGALPLACRQFPRVVVADPRGVSVVLSHYCPTAAASLDRSQVPGPRSAVHVVENPPAFPSDGEYVGLDARDALPPLLRPDVLMDWESWWAFESRATLLIGNCYGAPSETLRHVAEIVEDVRAWKPGEGALGDRVERAFGTRDLPERPDPDHASTDGAVLNRFLAAHAFGSWIAHLGGGLRTWRRSLDAALALAGEHGVRHADLRLRHLEDTWALADRWSAEAEGDPVTAAARRSRRASRATRSSTR